MDMRRLPVLPAGLGDQSCQFAEYILVFCQLANAGPPRIQGSVLDERLGQVIENKALSWKTADEFGSNSQMPRINQDVVRQMEFFQDCNPAQEFRLQKETIVGFALHDVANPN